MSEIIGTRRKKNLCVSGCFLSVRGPAFWLRFLRNVCATFTQLLRNFYAILQLWYALYVTTDIFTKISKHIFMDEVSLDHEGREMHDECSSSPSRT